MSGNSGIQSGKMEYEKKLKVLHVASFSGNVGDNANHNGAFNRFSKNIQEEFEFERLEIRKSFLNYQREDRWCFDKTFVEKVNKSDVCFIGGGNYFELWLDSSSTGTTVDISLNHLSLVEQPLIFYALGCDLGMGATQQSIDRFRGFVEFVCSKENMSIYLRNDGSLGNFKRIMGNDYAESVGVVPDGGFFVDTIDQKDSCLYDDSRLNIAVNVAGDMLDVRFKEGEFGYQDYVRCLVKVLEKIILEHSATIIFFPHIYKDIQAISDCLDSFSDCSLRNYVKVAPLVSGSGVEKSFFGLYEQCHIGIAMRFHANVCPIGKSIPTIALCCYPQISGLYSELGLDANIVHVNKGCFFDNLVEKVNKAIENYDDEKKRLGIVNRKLAASIDMAQKSIYKSIVSRSF